MNQKGVLVFLIRVGITCLCIATLMYIFWPTVLDAIFDTSVLRKQFVNRIENYPGFSPDWLYVASLITVYAYLYGYIAIALVTEGLLRLFNVGISQGGAGRDQWKLLSYVMVDRNDFRLQTGSTDYQSIASVIRDYSMSREGIGSVVLDIVSVVAVSYIGYTSLQALPSSGGFAVRVVDAAMIWLWCHGVFSILMWFVFVLAAWFQSLRHSN